MTTTPTSTDDHTVVELTTTDAAITHLAAHPDNPRRALGDLTELVRSIKSHGVLQPLLVLPTNDDGIHLIVAGHRRHAAAIQAGLDRVPITVRDLNESDVIEAMLIENTSRDDLTINDEVTAIAKLISLDGALTPAKLCKRIGKSQRWVRDRMTITVLATCWLGALGDGRLTLAQAVAAAGCADLGADHLDAVCAELANSGGWDRDPARTVERYRRRVKLDAAETAAIAKCEQGGIVHFTTTNPPPSTARTLTMLGIEDRAHRVEPCHAVYIQRDTWSDRLTLTGYCTTPKRHQQPTNDTPPSSAGVANRPERDRRDDPQIKRRARLARLAAGTEMFARRRGAPTSSEMMVLALQSYIDHANHDATKFAATMLGLDSTNPLQTLAAHAATGAAGLARTAGAIACGTAEVEAYHSTRHGVLAWYRLLADHGWEPDEWTATRITHATQHGADSYQPDDTDEPNESDETNEGVETNGTDEVDNEPDEQDDADDDTQDDDPEGA
jgi:ParB/RepB/Spo0J family partition protein